MDISSTNLYPYEKAEKKNKEIFLDIGAIRELKLINTFVFKNN